MRITVDYDGDTIQLVVSPQIVRNTKSLLPLICEGVSSKKVICNMGNLHSSCELGVKGAKHFNIGSCINFASSMFATRSHFSEDSEEYKELTKRIMLSQAISQQYIDFRKSGEAMKMPKFWYNRDAIDLLDVEEQEFNLRILASKKPMFMRNIYRELNTEYNEQYDMLNLKSIALFGITAEELLAMKQEDMTANQRTLVNSFTQQSKFDLCDHSTMSTWECQAEKMLKDIKNLNVTKSTGELLKSGIDYDTRLDKEVRELVLTYNNDLDKYGNNLVNIENDKDKRKTMLASYKNIKKEKLYSDVLEVCNNNLLVATDVMITVCYRLGRYADMLFELFGEQIYNNILNRKSYISVIMGNTEGNYTYKYANYSVEQISM